MLNPKSVLKINLVFSLVLVFFGLIIFLPAVYILKYSSNFNIFANPAMLKAVALSFLIGIVVTLLNLLFGIPLAWVLARSKSRWAKLIDNLVDLSLVVPTAALGFSIYLYWGTNFGLSRLFGLDDGLVSRGPIMIVLLHLVFTLPYMIRSVSTAIKQLSLDREEAAMTLGASPFAFFRTIAAPLCRDGIINGSILSFTRSLSETGATMMVAGALATAPVLIINLKNQGNLSEAAGASVFLILSAIAVLLLAKVLLRRRKASLDWAWPKLEKSISSLAFSKNIIIFAFFALFIFFPTIQIIFYGLGNVQNTNPWLLVGSLAFSLALSLVVTLINLIMAVPFAYLVARNRYRLGALADTLSEIVLLVPTSALGLSLVLFWQQYLASDILILLLAHLSFTFPLLVKPIASAFKEISYSQEEVSYSLGAGVKKTFLSILLPQIKPAIVVGCIMAFMRSLSETGATLAVSKNIKTIAVLIVELFQGEQYATAALACVVLFVITFVLLYFLKRAEGFKPKRSHYGVNK